MKVANIIIIVANKTIITNVIPSLKKHGATPSMIVAMNGATPIDEGGNFENQVKVDDVIPINCVMFPSYWVPQLSLQDREGWGDGHTRDSLKDIGESSQSLSTKWLTKYGIYLYFTHSWASSILHRGVHHNTLGWSMLGRTFNIGHLK